MRNHMPIRARMKSWRTAVAIAGVAAMAVTLGQSVLTLANPNDAVSTDGSQIATGNFFPTPLTASVRCVNPSATWVWDRRAEVQWDPVPGATGYRVEFVDWGSNGNGTTIVRTDNVDASTTKLSGITAVIDGKRYQMWPRVRTVNGPAVSSGYTTPPQRISYKSATTDRTECENTSPPSAPNFGWENTSEWNPSRPAPASAGQQPVTAVQRLALAPDVEQVEEDRSDVIVEAVVETSEETRVPAPDETNEKTSPSSTTPATARPPITPRESSTAAPSPSTSTQSSTSSKSTPAPTSSRPSSTASPATTTTQPPNEPMRLPGGGQAEIVDGTKLVISGTGAPQCSVTVRKSSTLEVRDGVLEVADSVETRTVDLESCELSEI